MAVLADPDQREIEAAVRDEPTVPVGFGAGSFGARGRRATVDLLDATWSDSRPDPPLQPLAERALVAERQPDVLVEMERGDARPVDPAGLGETVKELTLRRGRREDHADPVLCGEHLAESPGRVHRGRGAHRG